MKSSDVDPRNGTSPNGIPLLTSHLHGLPLSPARPSRWDGEKADLQPGEQAIGTREEKRDSSGVARNLRPTLTKTHRDE